MKSKIKECGSIGNAKELLGYIGRLFKRDKDRWVKGTFARKSPKSRKYVNVCDPEAQCFCAIGAIYRFGSRDSVKQKAENLLRKAITNINPNRNNNIIFWNDDTKRTAEEVSTAFLAAARLAK